eukprot:NODE_290_length_11632_cov_0.441256.p1 type:complete len:1241 gc:universal NODE_290_length_11632_cov_0.441256:2619-6341(+)
MSRLDKLSIRGIRSYAPDDAQIIDFCTPLTLIVGKNGCGKTTIIESLMYASTGSLPALSKGGAFIYDPKIAGETSVKAQIRLRFNDVSSKRMTMNRNLQASQTKKGVSMKTLEALLQVEDENGGSHNITQKCADVNAEIQNRLGVSKAILENVIFVHQEECNWPLSEPAVLKKKFDDIFSATEYAKMVKSLLEISKKLKDDLKLSKTELKYLNENKNKSVEKKIQMRQTSDKITAYKKDISALEESLNSLNLEMDQLVETTKSFNSIETLLNEYKSKRQHILQNADDLKLQINPMPTESNEELQIVLDMRREELSLNQSNLQQLQLDLDNKQSELIDLQNTKDSFISSISKLQLQQQRLLEKQSALDNMHSSRFKLEQELRECESKLQSVVDIYNNNKRQLEYNVPNNQNHDLLLNLKSTKSNLESQIQSTSSKLKQINLNKPINNVDTRHQIELLKQQQDLLKNELTSLNQPKDLKLQNDIALAKEKQSLLDELQTCKKQQSMIQSTTNEYYTSQQSILMPLISFVNDYNHINSQLFNKQSSLQSLISTTNTNIESTQLQVYQTSAKLDELNEKIQQFNETSVQFDAKLKELNCNDYSTRLEQLTKNVELSKGASILLPIYEKYITDAKHGSCGLCHREFVNNNDKTNFLNDLTTMLRHLKDGQNKTIAFQSELTTLMELKPLYDKVNNGNLTIIHQQQQCQGEYNMQQGRLQQLKREIKKYQSQLETVKASIVETAKIVDLNKTDLSRINEIKGLLVKYDAIDIDAVKEMQSSYEVKQHEMQISKQDINNRLTAAGTKQHELEKLELQQQHELESYLQRVEASKDLQRELNTLQNQFASTVTNLDKQQLQVQQDELKTTSIKNELSQLGDAHSLEKQRIESEIIALNSRITSFIHLENEIKELEGIKINTKLDRKNSELSSVNKQISSLGALIVGLQNDMQNKDALEMGAKQLERTIEDVFKYRKWMKNIEEIDDMIHEKQSKLSSYNVHLFSKRQHELTTSISDKTKRIASLNGQTKQLDDQRKELSKELMTYYKDANLKHHTTLVSTITGELAIGDLTVYAVALDQAIMTYHSQKMRLVNDIIRELWVETYQGNDIDTIEIKTEVESKGNKSYNYRVCMVKGDVNIDMRGRCSAGQKVLACIIIRLALAQVFGTNCGILALDEPTTNLDKGNILALASSLCKIIETRRKQSNFQLIVITHDEQFLNIIGKKEFIDYYYKITKNINQASVIKRVEAE